MEARRAGSHDTTQAEQRTVDEPVATLIAPPRQQSGHKSREGWLLPTGVAAVAAWVVGWVSGVRWAWREMGPRHHRRPASRG